MTLGDLRMVLVLWWLQVKIRSRSAMLFATTIFLIYRSGGNTGPALISAAVGAAVMGVWSATSTTASSSLQMERRMGTLELLVAAPKPFPLVLLPVTLSMATIGGYSLVATLLWGRFVFGIPIAVANLPGFILGIAVTVAATGMLGFLLAVSFVRYRTAWAIGSTLEMPVWLICGFIVPLGLLPDWVRPISWVLAPTWGMAAIRGGSEGGPVLANAAICVGLGVAYGLIGALVSRRLLDSARRHASLALS
jgi:ABC-2 type transport system permease protein